MIDHSQALWSSVAKGLEPQIRPSCQTWLRTVESDVAPLNIGLPVIEHKIDRHGGRSREWQHQLDKPL